MVDRSDPDLKYLIADRNAFNDPTKQAEWTQKRLIWIPHEQNGFVAASIKKDCGEEEAIAARRPGSFLKSSKLKAVC